MFTLIKPFMGYIYIALALAVLGYIGHKHVVISSLKATQVELEVKLEKAQGNVVVEKANNTVLRAAIKDMNLATEKLGIKHIKALAAYEAEAAKPDKIRYRTLYKYAEEVKSNECEDIKNTVDSISRYVNGGL